jgi:predicted ester cyclase
VSDIRKLIETYFDTLIGRGDFAQFFADDVTFDMMGAAGIPTITGRDAVEKFIRNVHYEAFDTAVSIRRVLVDGDGAAAEVVFAGVHTGEFAGVPATRARVELPYSAAYDFTGDAISAIRIYLSVPDLIAQLQG